MTRRPSSAWLLPPITALLLTAGCPATQKGHPEPGARQPATCLDTCLSLGHVCGDVCGQPCGTCSPDDQGHPTTCVAGQCRCIPVCPGTACGQGDGCGGVCPCAEDVSCGGCLLRLVRLDQRNQGSAVQRVTLALESGGSAVGAAPRLADFRVTSSPAMRLDRLEVGPSLADARKLLHRFVDTNLPYSQEEEGTYRVVVQTGARHTEIPPGRWLTLHFVADNPVPGPVRFNLARHPDLLAPALAEVALQTSSYDNPLVVSPVR